MIKRHAQRTQAFSFASFSAFSTTHLHHLIIIIRNYHNQRGLTHLAATASSNPETRTITALKRGPNCHDIFQP
jgi:hypothetical protein